MTDTKPFDKSFVLTLTAAKMKQAIDNSIRKCIQRTHEFREDHDKKMEILETCSVLETMKKGIEEFEHHNQHLFGERK